VALDLDTLETYLGNAPADLAHRCLNGVDYPHPALRDTYVAGCTEPYIVQAVCSLLVAQGGRTVLECGGFLGVTSAWLAWTLHRMGGGTLHVAELEAERARACDERLQTFAVPDVDWHVWQDDVFNVIAQLPNESLDFVWLDDTHTHEHVDRELAALLPKMRPGTGLICGHDVEGSCDLQQEFRRYGGYALRLPRLGPAGGLGILEVS
jgi:predicted O-methyltransferase YrrM